MTLMGAAVSSSVRRYAFIDSMRGIAILGVIAVHTAQWVQPGSEFLRRATAEGARGVQLFFVASALTIFMSLRSRSAVEVSPIRNYFLRRFFRIAPLFYLGIVLWLLLDGFAPRYWAPHGIDGWTVLLTASFMHGFHPETITSLVPGGWSIAVEMTFYLVAPILFRYVNNLRVAVLVLVITLIINVVFSYVVKRYLLMPYYSAEQQYLASNYVFLWFFAQLPVFILGLIAYHVMNRGSYVTSSRQFGHAMLVTVVMVWALLLQYQISSRLLPSYVLYGASFVLLALALAAHPTRLLVNAGMRKVGEISFSLYIFHFVVLNMFEKTFFRDGFPLQDNVGFWVAWVLVTVTSCIVSLVTYRYIERPGIAIGKFLIDRLERNSAWKSA